MPHLTIRSSGRRAVLAALLAATPMAPALAGDVPRYEPAPAWVAEAKTLPDTADEAGLVLFDRAFKMEGGELWSFTDIALKITSPEMLSQAGTMSVAWQPDQGDLVIHRLEIVRDGKTLNALAGGRTFEILRREAGLERLTIDGQLTATHQVQGLRLGDTLRFASSKVERDTVLDGNAQLIAPLVTEPVSLGGGGVRLMWPTARPITWKISGVTDAPSPVAAGRYTTLTLPQPVAKLPEAPVALPARLQPVALIEATSFADWAAVSALGARLFAPKGLIADGSELAAKADAIAAASPDKAARAAGALRLVQDEVRYLFNGLDGGNYRPQTPADTWRLRYGDCKAKTLLLLALLDRLDVPAEAAFVNTQMLDAAGNRVPSFAAFDHVIVRADIDGRTAWLDGTKVGDRQDDLFVAPPFRVALPALASGGAIVPIAMGAAGRADQTVRLDTDASAGLTLPARFTLNVVARDEFAGLLKATMSALDRRSMEDQVDAYVGSIVPNALVATRDWAFDEATGALTVNATGIRALDWSGEGGQRELALATVADNLSLDATRFGDQWADAPVVVPVVSHLDQTDIVRLPRLGEPFALDGEAVVDATVGGLALSRSLVLDGDVVTFREGRHQAAWEIAAADLPTERERAARLRSVSPRIVAPIATPLHWAEVQRARTSGALTPIKAAYDAQVERAEPDDPAALLARADFHERTYDRTAAAADLAAALRIKPDEETLAWRGAVLTQVDPAAATADLTQALALDPTNEWATLTLFELHMDRGDLAKAEAVTERAAGTGVEAETVAALRADLLAARGRAADGLTLLTDATRRKANTPAVLNVRCWYKARFQLDLPQALKDCTKAIQLGSEPADYLDSRALVYMRMGRMDEALADLDSALELDPDSAETLYKRALVRTSLGRPGSGEDMAAANGMEPSLAARYARWGIKP